LKGDKISVNIFTPYREEYPVITEIGIAAGDIWHYLDEKGSATLDELVRHTRKDRSLLLMSLGWLAREGHINLGDAQSGFRAALTEKR